MGIISLLCSQVVLGQFFQKMSISPKNSLYELFLFSLDDRVFSSDSAEEMLHHKTLELEM